MDFENIINGHELETTFNYKDVPLLDKETISNNIDDDNIIYHKNDQGKTISNNIDKEDGNIINHRNTNNEKITRTNSLNNFQKQNNGTRDFKHTNGSIDEKQLYKDISKIIQTAVKKNGCMKYRRIGFLSKLKKCTRRLNYDRGFLRIMTKLLNTYINSQYKFTMDMTEVLLEKILGKNTDLRHDILDVNNLLIYLRGAMRLHKKHETPDKISLKSKRCLTISLPGCFCRPGFVESFGQCVKPSDCVDESIQAYLSRVVVL